MFQIIGFIEVPSDNMSNGPMRAIIDFDESYENGSVKLETVERGTYVITYNELRNQLENAIKFNKDTEKLSISGIMSQIVLNGKQLVSDVSITIDNATILYETLQRMGHTISIEFASPCD